MNVTEELRIAGDDRNRPQELDLDAIAARGRRRRRRRRLATLASAAAVVVAAVASAGLLRTALAPGGTEADCAAVIDLDGRRYTGYGDLLTTPPTTSRTAVAVEPGCDDTGDRDVSGSERVTAHELKGISMSTAVLVFGRLYLAEGAELTPEMRAWFRAPTCSHDGSVTLVGRWLGVTSDKPVRYDGDVRAPLRIELAVDRSSPDIAAYDGWRIHVSDDGSAVPALTPADVKAALWGDALLQVRVHCDGKVFVADSFRALP